MSRREKWQLFCQEIQPWIEDSRKRSAELFTAQAPVLKQTILQLLEQAQAEYRRREKEPAIYFYFSILKVDVTGHQYTAALQVMDEHWYLDETQVEVYGDMGFWFREFDELFRRLLQARKRYIGMIDPDDIHNLMFDELDLYNSTIAHYLRYLLREPEQEAAFSGFPLEDYWVIRWGEYNSDTELVIQKDMQQKTRKDWEKALLLAAEQPQWLAGSFWYRLKLAAADWNGKDCSFASFMDCEFSEVSFAGCKLIGSRFPGTVIRQSSFAGADLRDADLSGCRLEAVDFTGAEVAGAVFPLIPEVLNALAEEQLSSVYVKEETA